MKRVLNLFVILVFAISSYVFSQTNWTLMDGPYGGTIFDIQRTPNGYLFVGTTNGIYRSENNGESWQKISTIFATEITCNSNAILYTGTPGGEIYKSTDYGGHWTETSQGVTNSSIAELIIAENNYIYAANAGIPGDIFLSTDEGESWEIIGEGLAGRIKDIIVVDTNNVFVTSMFDGVIRTTDFGKTWQSVNNGLPLLHIRAITYVYSNTIILAANDDIYFSKNNGDMWEKRYENLSDRIITLLKADSSGNIYAGNSSGEIFFSSDTGYSWTLINKNFKTDETTSLAISDSGTLFFGTKSEGIIRTEDNGLTWEYANYKIRSHFITSLLTDSLNRIYAGTIQGVFRSEANGANWQPLNAGLEKGMGGYEVIKLAKGNDGKIYSASHQGVYALNTQNNRWENLRSIECASFFISDSGYLFAGSFFGSIYRSVDKGINWEESEINGDGYYYAIRAFTQNSDGTLFSASDIGILHSSDQGKTWNIIPSNIQGERAYLLSCSSNDVLYTYFYLQGIYRSFDSGYTWEKINDNIDYTNFTDLISNSEGETFLATWGVNGRVFMITDHGDTWQSFGLSGYNINTLFLDEEEYLYAGTLDGFIFKTDEITTSISENRQIQHKSYILEQNYPNPFNPTTTISYALTDRSNVRLEIYNLLGEKIGEIVNETQNAGWHYAVFNSAAFGRELPSGIYIYSIKTNNGVLTKKMVLLK